MSSQANQLHQDLLDQVAQLRTSEQWLQAMAQAARFHDYSLGNWLLLWSQAERRGTTVTRPAGYRKWQDLARQVRKGETGYRILAPVTRKVKVERAEDEDTEMRVVGFRVVTVFDPLSRDFSGFPGLDEQGEPNNLSLLWGGGSLSGLGLGFDGCCDVVVELFGSAEGMFDTFDFELAGGDLPGWLAHLVGSGKRSPVAGKHAAEDGGGALLGLGVDTAQTDQALGAVLAGGEGAQVGAHVPH